MLTMIYTLALRTIREPREVARELIAMEIDRTVLWSALGLAVILNTIIYQITLILSPPQVSLPLLFSAPLVFAVLIGAGLVMSIYALTYAGRFLGGKAALTAIMTLLVWLQFLRFALQLATFILLPIMPGLGGLLVLAATLYGMWILLQFIDVAHEFDSLATTFGALVLSGLAIMVGLAIALNLVGIQNLGLTPYV